MSANPQPEPPPVHEDAGTMGLVQAEPGDEGPPYRWHDKLLALLGVIFCFELGVFLVVFPWATEWDINYFPRLPLWLRELWISPYFRGAVSGLGLVNIYISFVEVFRLRRFYQ
jgi:hypothetical protein